MILPLVTLPCNGSCTIDFKTSAPFVALLDLINLEDGQKKMKGLPVFIPIRFAVMAYRVPYHQSRGAVQWTGLAYTPLTVVLKSIPTPPNV